MGAANELMDTQKLSYESLLNKRLPELIKSYSTEFKDDVYKIECSMFPIDRHAIAVKDGTDYYPLRCKWKISNNLTREEVTFNTDLLNIPVFYESGFKVHGNYIQMLDIYERSCGWSFTIDMKKGKELPEISATALGSFGRTFSFLYDKSCTPYVLFKKTKSRTKMAKVPVSVFFRALTGMSNSELLIKFGRTNQHVVRAFSNDAKCANVASCIECLSDGFYGKSASSKLTTVDMKKRELEKDFFSRLSFNFGKNNHVKFDISQSFKHRATGKILGETIIIDGKVFEEGTILTTELCEYLDAMPIQVLKVKYNGVIHQLRKFSTFTFRCYGAILAERLPEFGFDVGRVLSLDDLRILNNSELTQICVRWDEKAPIVKVNRRITAEHLTREDLFTAFTLWMDNINGFNVFDAEYELSNRVCIPYDEKIYSLVNEALSSQFREFSAKIKSYGDEESILTAIANIKPFKDSDAFLELLSKNDKKENQMNDMCNIISYMARSNKLTTDIPSETASPEMRGVQSSQEGRLDPFDSPESKHVGLVHHKTLFSKVDESGQITTPYLEVYQGEIISEEPVMLTAFQESGKNIAMWCETFKNADGTRKERVQVRCDGIITLVDIDKVHYREYSPLQNMSLSHGLVTLAGHSNGKRITMACNEVTQVLPTVNNPERPYLGTGVESIVDFGTYSVDSVLNTYYSSLVNIRPDVESVKANILSSSLILKNIKKIKDQRILTFDVAYVNELNKELSRRNRENEIIDSKVTLHIPFLVKNFHDAQFGYRINHKKRVYSPGDVIAYTQGYSLEKKERIDLVDFGAYKVKDGTFDKGLALGRNLLCGYKTFDSSTIEDAFTISSRLVYDDTLTHLRLFMCKDTLYTSDSVAESFGYNEKDSNSYFNSNGLPKIGTYLQPGDKVIAKISQRYGSKDCESRISQEYYRLKPAQEGTVISAEIVKKRSGELEAQVLLATRACAENGDKMAGRHGNKGTIARIVPEEEMPYDPISGHTLDICISPLGVPSRQNISQSLEVPLAFCRYLDGKNTYISPYHPDEMEFIQRQIEQFDVKPIRMIDGRTGNYFKRPINVGVIYMYKLQQVVAGRVHAIGLDARVDPTWLQPRKGSKNDGGQSFGEMENWCLHSVGANTVLNDIYGLQSDDAISRSEFIKSFFSENPKSLDTLRLNEDFNNNCNDFVIKAYMRSQCSELISDASTNQYQVVPLTDEMIKSFSPEPVDSEQALHSEKIFGNVDSIDSRVLAKQMWGWLSLNCEMVHPFWVNSSKFTYMVELDTGSKKEHLTPKNAESIISGQLYVKFPSEKEVANRWQVREYVNGVLQHVSPAETKFYLTGMPALVKILRGINLPAYCSKLNATINSSKYADPDSRKSDAYKSLIAQFNEIETFIARGNTIEDFIITTFPIVPQSLRMKVDKGISAQARPDFDHYYAAILNDAKKVKNFPGWSSEAALYNSIRNFTIKDSSNNSNYKNVPKLLTGKDDKGHHGKFRENVQSKRIMCSGRAVITPARSSIKPNELGVPAIMLYTMYLLPLIEYFSAKANGMVAPRNIKQKDWKKLFLAIATQNVSKFEALYMSDTKGFRGSFITSGGGKAALFSKMKSWFVEFFEEEIDRAVEGKTRPVVMCGRQPSLHRYSDRAFYPVVLWSRALEINTMLCAGYNADFDGDMEWISACLSEQSKAEALEKFSVWVDFINPKNSSIMLQHTQDIVLGCYVATMLKDNSSVYDQTIEDAHYYSDLKQLEFDVKNNLIESYDLVCFQTESNSGSSSIYLSTAGRILFNACLADGFTDKEFSNPLDIKGVTVSRFRDLKFDGIITSSHSSNGDIVYCSLSDICMDSYLTREKACIDDYYRIEIFGFEMSDLFSVTLSLDDLKIKSNKNEIIKDAAEKKAMVEQDYHDGLISEEDKKSAIAFIYSSDDTGVQKRVQADLIANLPRNNNLFIMMDSGARGNASQITHMCGLLGILGKTKNDSMENPITSNYYEGLTDFDVYMTSYSSRVGVSSTQMETRNAGYASRKLIYATDGLKIEATDCGKTNWWFDCKWDSIRPELTRFYPTEQWLNSIDKIKRVDNSDNFTIDSLLNDGFHTIEVVDQFNDRETVVIVAEPSLLKGSTLVDPNGDLYFSQMLKNGKFDTECLIAFDYYKTKSLCTSFGRIECRYNLSRRCKSELMYREARGLDNLQYIEKDKIYVITEDTLTEIEEKGLERIEARIALDCQCKDGICARCYGLKYSNLRLPKLGEYVGTETAQSIAEPAAQLTMDVINKGGIAGASIASGVDVFDSYLNGTIIGGRSARVADVPERSGYARIKKFDSNVVVMIEPLDKTCEMCQHCMQKSQGCCPIAVGNRDVDPACCVPHKIPTGLLLVRDGEWVKSGDAITAYTPVSDNITSVDDCTDPEIVLRKKQIVWVDNYYDIFHSQSIEINARHFELLAMVQNQNALVTVSDDPNFRIGNVYKIKELLNATGVEYQLRTSNLQETILTTSGFLTALTFSNQADVLKNAAFINAPVSVVSPISKISIGQKLDSNTVKQLQFAAYTAKSRGTKPIVNLSGNDIIYQEVNMETIENLQEINIDDINLDDIFGMGNLDVFSEDDTYTADNVSSEQKITNVDSILAEFDAEAEEEEEEFTEKENFEKTNLNSMGIF